MMRKTRPGSATTERRNPRSRDIDQKSARGILRVINREDAQVARTVGREVPKIARAVDQIASRMRKGGRLFYIGAGTSGRLGVLDASECPPTFGVPRTMVQGIIAGGKRALTESVEGAEDHEELGAHDLRARGLTAGDAVVGLAASGSTPYVLGALKYARNVGAYTIGVTMNRNSAISRIAHVTIAPETGPEVIAGSTRMKAGTAQKMVLNMLSTTVMVRLGHVYENWMINVAKTNQKLRERALRNLTEATGTQVLTARHALRQAGDNLPVALIMLKAGLNARQARLRLAATHGNLRKAVASASKSVRGNKRK
ncbi:MAG TPA: N-acetylmuramic acid 6-phosphate etherase [Candidatus Dormibacteraeota bacterium]|nr:N-acetylmuramic acid 6-phosphate etherase [Candidatus Dormibacteraeota bacterium]